MESYKPVPKIKYAMITGGLVYLASLLLQYAGLELTPEISNALPVVFALAVGYMTRDVEREELFHKVEAYIVRLRELREASER